MFSIIAVDSNSCSLMNEVMNEFERTTEILDVPNGEFELEFIYRRLSDNTLWKILGDMLGKVYLIQVEAVPRTINVIKIKEVSPS